MTAGVERVWEIIEDIPVCMVTTHAGGTMRSRPMHAVADQDAGCIYFLTDSRGAKDDEIADNPDVCLAFADVDDNTYLSLSGRAEVVRDAALAEELWSPEAQAWWPQGPGDADVRVVRVLPEAAEYWDARGNSATVSLKLEEARQTGHEPDLGANEKVRMGRR
jgi:general stress protein 26